MVKLGSIVVQAVRRADVWETPSPKVYIQYSYKWGQSTIVRVLGLGRMRSDLNNAQLAEIIRSSDLLAPEITEVVVVETGWNDGKAKILMVFGLGD